MDLFDSPEASLQTTAGNKPSFREMGNGVVHRMKIKLGPGNVHLALLV